MRKIWIFFVYVVFTTLSVSCSDPVESVVFYSKDTLISSLDFNYKGMNQQSNDSSTIDLSSSEVFLENMPYLKGINIEKLSFKIINVQGSLDCINKMYITLGDDSATKISLKDFKLSNLGVAYEITNSQLLNQVASILVKNKKITVYCKESQPDNMPFSVTVQFSVSLNGTFID